MSSSDAGLDRVRELEALVGTIRGLLDPRAVPDLAAAREKAWSAFTDLWAQNTKARECVDAACDAYAAALGSVPAPEPTVAAHVVGGCPTCSVPAVPAGEPQREPMASLHDLYFVLVEGEEKSGLQWDRSVAASIVDREIKTGEETSPAAAEKAIRVKYQDVVYRACAVVDHLLGRTVLDGTCTTIDTLADSIKLVAAPRGEEVERIVVSVLIEEQLNRPGAYLVEHRGYGPFPGAGWRLTPAGLELLARVHARLGLKGEG